MAVNVIDKLNKVPLIYKTLAFVGIAAAVVAYFYFMEWAPLEKQADKFNNEFLSLERKYNEQKAVADDLATFQANTKRLEEELQIALKQLPKEKEIPSLLRDIYIEGRKSGVDFKSFQPMNEVARQQYAEVPIKLSLTGTYHEVAVFFDRVGKLSRIVNISDLDFGAGSSGKDGGENMLNVTCTAMTFMFMGESNL